MSVENDKLFNLTYEDKLEYLYAYVSGDTDTLEISRQFWREIADECIKRGSKKLMIVEDIKEAISIPEMFELASELPLLGLSDVRIAFVDRYVSQHELNQFGEIVAKNRGMYGKIFNDAAIAEDWLLER